MTIGSMFTYSKNAYGENNITLNSHLMKNSEWGAVVYLTDSKYGRNGTEIAINNSDPVITGSSGGIANATTNDIVYEYNSENGFLAGTTGNIYGIYDMSGGDCEYVAGYYKDGNLTHAQTFATGESDAYSTVYVGTEMKKNYIVGDATYETYTWNQDIDGYGFINVNGSVFSRGGWNISTYRAGLFYFGSGGRWKFFS